MHSFDTASIQELTEICDKYIAYFMKMISPGTSPSTVEQLQSDFITKCLDEKLRQWRKKSSIKTYLRAVILNYLRDYFKSTKGKSEKRTGNIHDTIYVSVEGEEWTVLDLYEDKGQKEPIRILLDAERLAYIHHCLEKLPARQRLAIRFCEWEGLSYDSIAKLMAITPGGVARTLSEGRRNLQKCLKPYFQFDSVSEDDEEKHEA